MHNRNPTNWVDYSFRIGCVALVAAGFFLRSWQLGESLWVDELHTSWVVSGDWAEIPQRAAMGNQPPVYFFLVRLAIDIFGQTEWSLRFLSLIAGVLTQITLGFIAWRWTGSRIAVLLTLFIAAVDHELLFYSGEARSYALLQLLGAIHLATLVELIFPKSQPAGEKGKLRMTPHNLVWGGWITTGFLLLQLHYIATYVLLLDVLFVMAVSVWLLRNKQRKLLGLLGGLAAMAVVGTAPYLWEMTAIVGRSNNWKSFISTDASLVNFFMNVWPAPAILLPPLIAAAICQIVRRIPASDENRDANETDGRQFGMLPIVLFAAIAPAVAAWVATRFDWLPLFHARFFAPSLPAFLLIPAAAYPLVCRRPIRIGLAIGVAAGVWWFSGIGLTFSEQVRFIADRNEGWKSAVAALNEEPEGLPILLYSGLIEYRDRQADDADRWAKFATLPLWGIYRISDDRTVIPLPTALGETWPQLEEPLQTAPAFDLVVRGNPPQADIVADWCNGVFPDFTATATKRFGAVSIYRFERE